MPIRFVDFSRPTWRRPGQPYTIALLSDIHFGNQKLRQRQITALRSIDRLMPAYVVLMGDNVETSRPEHYAVAHELLAGLQTAVLPMTGNHELFPHYEPVDHCLEAFYNAFGVENPYSHRVVPPYQFIMLGIDERNNDLPHTTRDTGISAGQLAWFRKRLAEHPDLPTVVITHAPILGTVENSEYFCMAQSAELNSILRDHPQICLWISGHTHLPDTHQGRRLRTLFTDARNQTFLHVPSVADYYVHLIHGRRRYFHTAGLQTRYLECLPDQICINTIDLHTGETWVEGRVVPGRGLVKTAS